jgi:hypothetical protein
MMMKVVVTIEAESVSEVLKALHGTDLNIVKVGEEESPKVNLHASGYRGESQSKVADAVRSQIAPAVTGE